MYFFTNRVIWCIFLLTGWSDVFFDLQGDLMCDLLDKRCPESGPHKAYIGFRYAKPLTEDTLDEMEKYASTWL